MTYVPPPLWSFAPFALLLLTIAVFPLLPRVSHWWEHNSNKLLVALFLSLTTVLFYAFLHGGVPHHGTLAHGWEAVLVVLEHAVLQDYVPFIILLFSLYTISGGILLKGDIIARPLTNCLFLCVGALLASFIGTTGASMLLIRSILRTNRDRRHKVHTVVFFIFVVSNLGGCLTPLGDPPLFLGYLRGVEFWWTLNLFSPWLFTNIAVLIIYFIWDTLAYRREAPRDLAMDKIHAKPLSVEGKINVVWLLLVVACVATVDTSRPFPGTATPPPPFTREVLLLLLTAGSWFTTPGNRRIRTENDFNFHAIVEVACLFIGIFICMQPAIEFLRASGAKLGLETGPAFFWATGSLSSFLDNAPTYVVFFETAKSLTHSLLESGGLETSALVPVQGGVVKHEFLLAISLGAVFMGAMTYIGNGPNFMVKSIAEQSRVKMPSFFGFMIYSVCVLLPIFLVAVLLFL
jgi:Na+/H+ antiporter NhaD/arsenite permease-like protein